MIFVQFYWLCVSVNLIKFKIKIVLKSNRKHFSIWWNELIKKKSISSNLIVLSLWSSRFGNESQKYLFFLYIFALKIKSKHCRIIELKRGVRMRRNEKDTLKILQIQFYFFLLLTTKLISHMETERNKRQKAIWNEQK